MQTANNEVKIFEQSLGGYQFLAMRTPEEIKAAVKYAELRSNLATRRRISRPFLGYALIDMQRLRSLGTALLNSKS